MSCGNKAQKELAEKARNDRIKKQIKAAGLRGEVELNPKIPDVKELSFDDTHINQERSHNISEGEAKSYIEKARFSVTKWNAPILFFSMCYPFIGLPFLRRSNLRSISASISLRRSTRLFVMATRPERMNCKTPIVSLSSRNNACVSS